MFRAAVLVLLATSLSCGSQPQPGPDDDAADASTTISVKEPAADPSSPNQPGDGAVDGTTTTTAPAGGDGSNGPAATSPAAAGAAMPVRPPREGSYVYVRETAAGTKERTEKYDQQQEGDDHVVMFRETQFADVPVLNVEVWADTGVFWIQTRVPGLTTEWCKWPADNRPKVLPGDLSVPQKLEIDSTCTVRAGEEMTLTGVVEVKGPKAGTDLAVVEARLKMAYRGPARSASREGSFVSDFSPAEGLVISMSGTYSGTGIGPTELKERLRR